MKQAYPHACCSCGTCCLATPCPRAFEAIAEARAGQPCPALVMSDNGTHCELIRRFIRLKPEAEADILTSFGVGAGCCIKARAVHGSREEDFAALPDDIKRELARRIYEQIIEIQTSNRRTTS